MRRVFSRLLLAALAAAAAFGLWRLAAGGRGGDLVSLGGLHAEALAHEAFVVNAPARLAVDAAGSFEERPDTALAALGWIVRRSDGAVVWRQRPGRRPARGFVSAARDTLRFEAGTYDAYFASYGDPLARAAVPAAAPSFGGRIREALSRGGRAWQGEAGRWHLRVTGATAADRALAGPLDTDPADAEPTPDVVWATGALGNGAQASALIRVTAPAEVALDAVLEAAGGIVADSASLVRLGAAPDTVWAFRSDGSSWAGGSVKNRRARARLRLAPGLYRASATTDGTHAAGDWTANPPWAPWTWGLRVRRLGGDAAAVAVLDPAALAGDIATGALPVLAEMRCVGTDQQQEVSFTLTAPAEALLVAAGEVSGGDAYDYATLLRDGRVLWEMDHGNTEPGGGIDRNRRATVPFSLAAGTYTLRYRTDGSHDCEDDWASGESPDDESLWGAVLVALDPAFDASTVQRRGPVRGLRDLGGDDGPNSREPLRAAGSAETLVDLVGLGNDQRRSEAFVLAEEARVRVVALVELLPGERLDYAWIEDARGERVWETTRANTDPAGGSPKNRVFDGILTLDPGRYTAHAVTNGRHAAGDFEGGAPDEPDAWGLRIDRLGDEEVEL